MNVGLWRLSVHMINPPCTRREFYNEAVISLPPIYVIQFHISHQTTSYNNRGLGGETLFTVNISKAVSESLNDFYVLTELRNQKTPKNEL